MKILVSMAVITCFLASCSTAQIESIDNLAGMGVLSNEADAFDGSQRIRSSPAFVNKAEDAPGVAWAAPFTLGAQWRDITPNDVSLILEIDGGIEGIRAVGINVNGDATDYPTQGLTNIESNSSRRYVGPVSTAYASVPLSKFLQMVESENVMLRLYTLGGYVDADFSNMRGRGGALTARHYLKNRFVPELLKVGG